MLNDLIHGNDSARANESAAEAGTTFYRHNIFDPATATDPKAVSPWTRAIQLRDMCHVLIAASDSNLSLETFKDHSGQYEVMYQLAGELCDHLESQQVKEWVAERHSAARPKLPSADSTKLRFNVNHALFPDVARQRGEPVFFAEAPDDDSSKAEDTPILEMFHQHRALMQASSDLDRFNCHDAQDGIFKMAREIEKRMMDSPSTCAADFAAKFAIASVDGTCELDWQADVLWEEAKDLIGIGSPA